jgi:hypothetical protein
MKKPGTFDASLFDNWSRELAYLIGATLTDGCVHSADYLSGGYVYRHRAVEWNVADRDWLETLKRIMSATREIRTCERRHGTYYLLRVQGQEVVDAFARYGVLPRKTMTCRVPGDLPAEHFYHFLRGVIDGDGSVMVRAGGKFNRPGYKRLVVSIASGSEAFLQDIQKRVGGSISYTGTKGHAVYRLVFDCGKAADLLKKVYADSDLLRLERKYRKWAEFCESGEGYLRRVA